MVALSYKNKNLTDYYYTVEIMSLNSRMLIRGRGDNDPFAQNVMQLFIPLLILMYSQSFWKDLLATMTVVPFDQIIVGHVLYLGREPEFERISLSMAAVVINFSIAFTIITAI